MRKFIYKTLRRLNAGPILLLLHSKSALREEGWFISFRKRKVIDSMGNPIPWWTYSSIDFLKSRSIENLSFLEFGCGYSTIWLSRYSKYVLAFEDYPNWADKIRPFLNSKANIIEVESISNYKEYSDHINQKFDVLVIDNLDNLGNRLDCAINNIKHLNQ